MYRIPSCRRCWQSVTVYKYMRSQKNSQNVPQYYTQIVSVVVLLKLAFHTLLPQDMIARLIIGWINVGLIVWWFSGHCPGLHRFALEVDNNTLCAMMDDDETPSMMDDDGPIGGRNKRGRKTKTNEEPKRLVSYAAAYLQEVWSWGKYSPQECQRLASLVLKDMEQLVGAGDGAGFPDLTAMAKMGTDGKYPQHMHSAMDKLMPPNALPHREPIHVPADNRETDEIVPLLQYIMYPHVLLYHLYKYTPGLFFTRITPYKKAAPDFWKSVESTPQYKEHPLRHKPHHKRKCVPLFLHGDAVPVVGIGKSRNKCLDVWSFGSLLITDGKTMQTHFLVVMCYQMLAAGMATYDEFWVALCLSLRACYDGKHPATDHLGNSLEGTHLGKLAG